MQHDVNSFYIEKLSPIIEEIEKKRLRVMPVALAVAIGGIVICIAGFSIISSASLDSDFSQSLFYVFLGIALYGFTLAIKILKKSVANFKPDVIKPLLKFIEPNLHYMPESGISSDVFSASSLFTEYPDRYHAEDMISGKRGKTEVQFCEVHAEYKSSLATQLLTDTKEYHTFFKGIFFVADFNKNFKGTTLVVPDTAEKRFGKLVGNCLQKVAGFNRPGELTKLENQNFEDSFVVYSDDQIESRYILTPDLMRRITELSYFLPSPPYISFVNSKIHIALSSNDDLFESRIFSKVADIYLLSEYCQILQSTLNIVDNLDLNTRIWTKK